MPAFSLPALLRALAVWLLIIVAESVQGSLRRLLMDPDIEFVIRQGSVITGALVIFAITWFSARWMRIRTAGGALAVGGLWVALTVAFEFALGRALGLSWSRILEDYDVLRGGLMPIGLAFMAVTPWIVRRLQTPRADQDKRPV
ncbi:MAG: hypothetical protein ACOY5Y_01970 [Pseudomonadota bacterium]|jgi:hypothetical protein